MIFKLIDKNLESFTTKKVNLELDIYFCYPMKCIKTNIFFGFKIDQKLNIIEVGRSSLLSFQNIFFNNRN